MELCMIFVYFTLWSVTMFTIPRSISFNERLEYSLSEICAIPKWTQDCLKHSCLVCTVGSTKSPNQETKGQSVSVFVPRVGGGLFAQICPFVSIFILPWPAGNCSFLSKFCITNFLFLGQFEPQLLY